MIVVKVGGGAGVDLDAVCTDIAAVVARGEQITLVHGTSDAANTLAERMGVPVRTLQSPSGQVSRYTDAETLEIFTMAAAGQMNKQIVERLQQRGVNALGLSGIDGRLLQARRKEAVRAMDPTTGKQRIVRDDHTGKVETVNAALLEMLCASGYTPVIAPLALSEHAERLNVDGDRAAAQVAAALCADTLIILSNVPGLLARFPDESSLIPELRAAELDNAIAMAGGRMKKKILAAQEALQGGVRRVVLADSRRINPIQAAISAEGTVILS